MVYISEKRINAVGFRIMNRGGATRKNMIGVQKYPNAHERALGYSV